MALVDSILPIDFGQGVDTKTDPKLVVKGKLLSLQNGIFTNTKRITKRNGYTGLTSSIITGGTISSPTMCKSYKNELLVAGTTSGGASNGNRLFSYSTALSKWVDKGKYNSVAVSKQVIVSPETSVLPNTDPAQIIGTQNPSSATISGITVLGWEYAIINPASPAATSLYITALDNQTGTRIAPQTQITSAYGYVWGYSKVVALGSTQFAIFYIADTDPAISTAPKLCYKTVSVSGAGVVIGAEVQLNTTPKISNNFSYDVVNMSTGCFVAIAEASNAFEIYKINTAGVSTANSLISTAAAMSAISVALDATQTNAWVYYRSSSAVHYSIYNATTLASVLSDTAIETGLSALNHITAYPVSATQQTVLYSELTLPATSYTVGVYYPIIRQSLVTSGGSILSSGPFKSGVDLFSKPFVANGMTMVACVSYSTTNPIGIILDTSDGQAVAKFLVGQAEGVYSSTGNNAGDTYSAPVVVSMRHPSFLLTPEQISSTQFSIASGFVVSLTQVVQTSTTNLSSYVSDSTLNALMGVSRISFDFNHIDANQAIIQQETLVLNGGIVSQYDSASVTELGFTVDPDAVSIKALSSGGTIAAGLYTYYVIYEWTDALGNLHRSAPSLPIEVYFSTGTSNSVSIAFQPLDITQKTSVLFKVYRTIANGTIPFLAGVGQNSSGTWGGVSNALIDTQADALIQDNEQLYTEGGAILENIAPPPAMILWPNNNRAWCVDSENPETNIEYSKTASQGFGISFSAGFLELVIDSRGGLITGASPMDEKTVILKQKLLGYFVGDGANDSGQNASFSPFQFIPAQTGCSNSKSIILSDVGIIFRSSNNKGIYSISRGLQVEYIGYEVEAYNSQDITSAVSVPDKTQIRFLTSSGSSLLYDYVMNQWSTFTNHAGLSADSFQGLYTYVRADGSIYQESQTSFQDNGTDYQLVAQTAWLDLSSVQNFERVRWVLMLGDYANGTSASHGMQIQAAYNFSSSFSTAVAKTFGAASSSGVFQYRNFFSTQKCDSLSLLITEITTGNVNESLDLTNMTLVAALKKGSYKLGAAASVG